MRRMFPHTITVYNVTVEEDQYFHTTTVNHITILRGVFVDERKAANVRASGLVGADAVDINIPADVEAVDGVTGAAKRYVGPMEWTNTAPEDRDTVWTMTLDGQGDGDTFLVLGEVVEPDLDLGAISQRYDSVWNITKVDDKRHGGLAHWEIGAN